MVNYCFTREQSNTSLIRTIFLGVWGRKGKYTHAHIKKLNNFPGMEFAVIVHIENLLIYNFSPEIN